MTDVRWAIGLGLISLGCGKPMKVDSPVEVKKSAIEAAGVGPQGRLS